VVGSEFSARFYRSLDELIGALSVREASAPADG
jgi:hypothetical protein